MDSMFYTISEVSALLNIPVATSYNLCRMPGFPSRKIGKHWRINKLALEKWSMTFNNK